MGGRASHIVGLGGNVVVLFELITNASVGTEGPFGIHQGVVHVVDTSTDFYTIVTDILASITRVGSKLFWTIVVALFQRKDAKVFIVGVFLNSFLIKLIAHASKEAAIVFIHIKVLSRQAEAAGFLAERFVHFLGRHDAFVHAMFFILMEGRIRLGFLGRGLATGRATT